MITEKDSWGPTVYKPLPSNPVEITDRTRVTKSQSDYQLESTSQWSCNRSYGRWSKLSGLCSCFWYPFSPYLLFLMSGWVCRSLGTTDLISCIVFVVEILICEIVDGGSYTIGAFFLHFGVRCWPLFGLWTESLIKRYDTRFSSSIVLSLSVITSYGETWWLLESMLHVFDPIIKLLGQRQSWGSYR